MITGIKELRVKIKGKELVAILDMTKLSTVSSNQVVPWNLEVHLSDLSIGTFIFILICVSLFSKVINIYQPDKIIPDCARSRNIEIDF